MPRHPRMRHRDSAPYRKARREMFATYGDICHICGHAGAVEADHLVPISRQPEQEIDAHAMRPAHGANGPCPTCGRKCNTERGNRAIRRSVRTSQDW